MQKAKHAVQRSLLIIAMVTLYAIMLLEVFATHKQKREAKWHVQVEEVLEGLRFE